MDITKRELLLRRGKERNTMELKSASYEKHEEVYDAVILEQWKACVEMANSNTEKRTNSNNIFITINTDNCNYTSKWICWAFECPAYPLYYHLISVFAICNFHFAFLSVFQFTLAFTLYRFELYKTIGLTGTDCFTIQTV